MAAIRVIMSLILESSTSALAISFIKVHIFPHLSHFLQTHKIDPSNHYLRLKVWADNQMRFFVPKLEDDISDLVRKRILKDLIM